MRQVIVAIVVTLLVGAALSAGLTATLVTFSQTVIAADSP